MSDFSMQSLIDSVLGSSVSSNSAKPCNAILTKADNQVRFHQLAETYRSLDKRFYPKNFLLMPGRLVFIDVGKESAAEFSKCESLLLTDDLVIEALIETSFRLYNSPNISGIEYSVVPHTFKEEEQHRTSMEITGAHKHTVGAIIMRFQKKEDMLNWAEMIMEEKDRRYFPAIPGMEKTDFRDKFHRALIKRLSLHNNGFVSWTSPLEQFYYRCQREVAFGPGDIALYFVDLFRALHIDILVHVEEFMMFLGDVVENLYLSMMFLGFDWLRFLKPLLNSYITWRDNNNTKRGRKSSIAYKPTDPATDDSNDKCQNSNGNEATDHDPVTHLKALLSLVRYMKTQIAAKGWREVAQAYHVLFELPADYASIPLHAPMWMSFYRSTRPNLVSMQWNIGWTELRCFLEPTPAMGFYFIDFHFRNRRFRKARGLYNELLLQKSSIFDYYIRSEGKENTAAHFLRYVDKDSIVRAYEEFESKNFQMAHNLEKYLPDIRAVYRLPPEVSPFVVKPTEASVHQQNVLGQIESSLRQYLATLGDDGRLFLKEGDILSTLLIRNWVRDQLASNEASCGLGDHSDTELGDEGKAFGYALNAVVDSIDESLPLVVLSSAIIIMTNTSKRVHILYDNADAEVMEREFSQCAPFYFSLGIRCTVNDLDDRKAQIVLLSEAYWTEQYRDGVFSPPRQDFRGVHLIIRNLDTIRVLFNPNAMYSTYDDEATLYLEKCYAILKREGSSAEAPETDLPRMSVLWSRAKISYMQAKGLKRGGLGGYDKVNGQFEYIDYHGLPINNAHNKGIEYIRYREADEVPELMAKCFYQSFPYLVLQYSTILAITKTSRQEEASMRTWNNITKAWSLVVPNDEFQDVSLTCMPSTQAHETENADMSGDIKEAAEQEEHALLCKLRNGILMNEFCEMFYDYHPYDKGQLWPSCDEHRMLVDFLESPILHNLEDLSKFAVSVDMIDSAADYTSYAYISGRFPEPISKGSPEMILRIVANESKYLLHEFVGPNTNSSGLVWDTYMTLNTLSVSSANVEGSEASAIRCETVIKSSKDEILNLLTVHSRLTEYDESVESSQILSQIDDHTIVRRLIFRTTWPYQSRDFVTVCTYAELDSGSAVVATRSLSNDFLVEDEEHVRGFIHVAGYYITRLGEVDGQSRCNVVALAHIDYGDSFPDAMQTMSRANMLTATLKNIADNFL